MAAEKEAIFAWSVKMLQKLKFDGDEDALAAYVDALVDNNRESEGGDLALLRSRTQRELGEFLGDADASSFVASLMRHLQKNVTTPKLAVSQMTEALKPMSDTPSAPAQHSAAPAQHSAAPGQKLPAQSAAVPSTQKNQGKPSAADPAPSKAAPSQPSRQMGRAHPLPGRGKPAPRDSDWSTGPRGSKGGMDRDGREMQGWGAAERGPGPRERSLSRGKESVAPPASGAIDLRNQLSRSRPASAKRDLDGIAPDDTQDRSREDRRDDMGGRGGGRVGGRGGGRGRERGDRNDDRSRGGPGFEPPLKLSRRSGNDAGGHSRGGFLAGGQGAASNAPSGDMNAPVVAGGMPMAAGGGMAHGMPPPPPEFFQQMQHMMANGGAPPPGFPPPPSMFGAPAMMNAPGVPSGFGGGRGGAQIGNGRGRGRSERGRGGHGSGAGRSVGRQLNSVLVVRNVPAEKLTLGALNEFFKTFGLVVNIQLRPAQNPAHAFIEFSQRSEAQAAMSSVDAILGNRHVRVHWAREQDFEAGGLSLAGVELSTAGGQSRKQGYQQKPAHTAAPAVPAEDPEIVLQRKRKEIAAAREDQMKAKAERQAEVDSCIAKQKELFAKLAAGDCSPETKKDILQEIKSLGKKADAAQALIKPKDSPSTVAAPTAAPPPRPQARPRGAMTADFRPKVVTISGVTAEGLSEANAAQVFRETASATKDGTSWVLDFSSRRAAESAANAPWLVKKHFGPEAVLTLSDVRNTAKSEPHREKSDADDVKETGSTNDTGVNEGTMAVDTKSAAPIAPEPSTVDIAQP